MTPRKSFDEGRETLLLIRDADKREKFCTFSIDYEAGENDRCVDELLC